MLLGLRSNPCTEFLEILEDVDFLNRVRSRGLSQPSLEKLLDVVTIATPDATSTLAVANKTEAPVFTTMENAILAPSGITLLEDDYLGVKVVNGDLVERLNLLFGEFGNNLHVDYLLES